MKIQIKLLNSTAKIPTKGSDFSAGYDLYTTEPYELKPGERHLYKTGISTAMPNGVYGRIAPRSGLAYKNGIDVMAGVIDSDYRNEIGVVLINLGQEPVKLPMIKDGKDVPIAQIIFENHNEAEFEKLDTLPESVRGLGGFGSSDDKKKVESVDLSTKSPKEASDLINKWLKTPDHSTSHQKYETVVREREKHLQ